MGSWVCEQCGITFTKPGTTPRRFHNRACLDEWTRRNKPSTEWLRQKYLDEGLSANDIARIVGRDPKRTWEWLKQAGIPTRPRGSYNTFALSGKTEGNMKGKRHSPETLVKITAAARARPKECYAGNGQYLRDRTGADHPNWKGGHTPERQAFYSTPEWKAVARLVWGRDKGICRRCGDQSEQTKDAHKRWHIHHIVGFRIKELRVDPENLVLLCPPCHRWVHGKSNLNKEFLG